MVHFGHGYDFGFDPYYCLSVLVVLSLTLYLTFLLTAKKMMHYFFNLRRINNKLVYNL